MTDTPTRNVLFICTGNSARSVLGEALMNHAGRGRLRAFSAGSTPGGTVNPYALRTLQELGVAVEEPRSKSWDEFAAEGAPQMDFIITVCDQAAGEACPYWPGQPMTAHWGMPDPAAVRGSESEICAAFRDTAVALKRRIDLMLALPMDKLEAMAINASSVTSASADAGDHARRLAAEGVGTALLLAVVIGSGIMAERLAAGNAAVALLANTAATVAGLYVLIEVFGPVSGAHFNPAVSLVMAWRGELPRAQLPGYVAAQLIGAVLGAWLAHVMFELPILQVSAKVRAGSGQWLAEAVATFGLLLVILKAPPTRIASLIAAWIGAAYWFTASTSFANPAAVIGRMFSDSFAGIAPSSAPEFVIAQLVGAVVAVVFAKALWR